MAYVYCWLTIWYFQPNLLSEDGTTSLAEAAFSPCAKYWAYCLSRSVSDTGCRMYGGSFRVCIQGTDSVTLYVRPTSAPFASGSHDDGRLPDELKYVKFTTICWDLKSEGFFYQVCIYSTIL
jgi:prolyl oligopeptidase